jgi:hypothetical protein
MRGVVHRIIQHLLTKMMCTEELPMFDSPELPASPSVEQAIRELYPHDRADTEAVRQSFAMFIAKPAPELGCAFNYASDMFYTEFSAWGGSVVQLAKMCECDLHTVHHTITLFLKFLHRGDGRVDTVEQWADLYWQRMACMWIAFKYSDSGFDDIESFTTDEHERKMLVCAEMQVMRTVDYELAPPPDYMGMLGVLLNALPEVMDRALRMFMNFSAHPAHWYGMSYISICSACILAARESLDGRPEIYIHQLRQLHNPDIPVLIALAERVIRFI